MHSTVKKQKSEYTSKQDKMGPPGLARCTPLVLKLHLAIYTLAQCTGLESSPEHRSRSGGDALLTLCKNLGSSPGPAGMAQHLLSARVAQSGGLALSAGTHWECFVPEVACDGRLTELT